MPVLLLKTGDQPPREIAVTDGLVIGRGASCDLPLDDERVSRRHATIHREGSDYFLKDLGSRNGTRLNGEPVAFAHLAFGDEIGIGRARLLFAERAPGELVGTVLGGYEVLQQIGAGGMGVVYRARQVTLDRLVAVKVLHPRLAADAAFVERFLREARAAGALNHVHLVHVHDAQQAGSTCFYVMEFVDGPTVAERLRTRGPIPPRQAVAIALHIASALGYVHREGLVHRDIKPENLMLAAGGTAKLADLGLARPIDAAGSDVRRGPDGKCRVWGTPAYMPPEVASGHEADPRSDLYSFGATLFHMLSGRVPFLAATTAEVLAAHVHTPLPNLQEFAPTVPMFINPIIERLMAKRPERRYQTADELLPDLAVLRETLRQAGS